MTLSEAKKRSDATPNPGSNEALDAGCKCPVIDNHHGKGWGVNNDQFIYNEDCPIHAVEVAEIVAMIAKRKA